MAKKAPSWPAIEGAAKYRLACYTAPSRMSVYAKLDLFCISFYMLLKWFQIQNIAQKWFINEVLFRAREFASPEVLGWTAGTEFDVQVYNYSYALLIEMDLLCYFSSLRILLAPFCTAGEIDVALHPPRRSRLPAVSHSALWEGHTHPHKHTYPQKLCAHHYESLKTCWIKHSI